MANILCSKWLYGNVSVGSSDVKESQHTTNTDYGKLIQQQRNPSKYTPEMRTSPLIRTPCMVPVTWRSVQNYP